MLHLLEIASVILLFAYMFFAYKQKSIAWIFGILGSIFSALLFCKKGFYGSMLLNGIYAAQGVLGYFEWKWKSPNSKPMYKLKLKHHIFITASSILFSVFLMRAFGFFNYLEFNYWDILLAALSIVATFLEIKKEISCWWYWMICNLSYAALYLIVNNAESPLYFYSILMFALAIFSWFAKKEWTMSSKNLKQV